MAFWESMNQRVKRFGVLELKLLQAAAIFFSLIIVKVFPEIMSLSIWWFVVLSAACAIRPVWLFFGRQ